MSITPTRFHSGPLNWRGGCILRLRWPSDEFCYRAQNWRTLRPGIAQPFIANIRHHNSLPRGWTVLTAAPKPARGPHGIPNFPPPCRLPYRHPTLRSRNNQPQQRRSFVTESRPPNQHQQKQRDLLDEAMLAQDAEASMNSVRAKAKAEGGSSAATAAAGTNSNALLRIVLVAAAGVVVGTYLYFIKPQHQQQNAATQPTATHPSSPADGTAEKSAAEQNAAEAPGASTGSANEAVLTKINTEGQINPFIVTQPASWFERFKLVARAWLLVPLRLSFILPAALFAYALASVSTLGQSPDDPIPAWKHALLLTPCKWLVRYILFLMGFHKIEVTGGPAAVKEAPIMVANHVSAVDQLFLFSYLLPSFVADKDVAETPVLGSIAAATLSMFIDSPGTVSDVIKRRVQQMQTHQKPRDGLLSQFENKLEVRFMDIYTPSDTERRDPALYSNNVRAVMAKQLGADTKEIYVTNNVLEDAQLLNTALIASMDSDSIPKKALKALQLLEFGGEQVNLNELKVILWRFKHMDTNNDGLISQQEFARAMGLPAESVYTEMLFRLLDKDESGSIDFKEFVLGLTGLHSHLQTADRVQLAFEVFGNTGRAGIDRKGFQKALQRTLVGLRPDEIDELFRSIDTNGDGFVSHEEFMRFLDRNPRYATMLALDTNNPSPPNSEA